MGYTTTNPYTNEVVKTFPDATDAGVDAALDKAHTAFLSWRTTSFNERLLAPERLQVDDPAAGGAVLVYQPFGIVFEVEPWNVPFFQVVRPLAPQLMAGNVVILKHASIVPQCAAAIGEPAPRRRARSCSRPSSPASRRTTRTTPRRSSARC